MEYLIKILLISVIISFSTVGIYAATWNDMILHKAAAKLKLWMQKKGLSVLYKPICGCLICMSSFWTIVAWIVTGFDFVLIPVMLCVAGINTVTTSLLSDIIPFDDGI